MSAVEEGEYMSAAAAAAVVVVRRRRPRRGWATLRHQSQAGHRPASAAGQWSRTYRFRYKGNDHTIYVGVMAQEVQKIDPGRSLARSRRIFKGRL